MARRGRPHLLNLHNWGTKMVEIADPPVDYKVCQGEDCSKIIPEDRAYKGKKFCSPRCVSAARRRALGIPRTTKQVNNYLR